MLENDSWRRKVFNQIGKNSLTSARTFQMRENFPRSAKRSNYPFQLHPSRYNLYIIIFISYKVSKVLLPIIVWPFFTQLLKILKFEVIQLTQIYETNYQLFWTPNLASVALFLTLYKCWQYHSFHYNYIFVRNLGIFIYFKILKKRALKMFQKLRKMAFLYAFGIQQAQGYRHVSDNLSMLRSSEVK